MKAIWMLAFLGLFAAQVANSQRCYEALIVMPTPFNGNGDEIILLDDGTAWELTSYDYLYLYEYNPSITVCPRSGRMLLDDQEFSMVPASDCYVSSIVAPVPFDGNGGEAIVLDDGSVWIETSYQYLYLYEYNPDILICPNRGKMMLNEHVFTISALN